MAETRITDEEMRQFGVGIPDPTGEGLKNVTNDYELDPMSLPVGANPETDWYVGRNELGEKTYRMGDGREYTVRRVVPEDRFSTEAGTMDRAKEVLGQRVDETVQGVTQAVTAPARAARGEGVTLGDALNTAGMAGTGTVGATTTARAVSGKSMYDPTEVSSFGASSNRTTLPMFRQFETSADRGLPDPFFGSRDLGSVYGDKPWQDVNTGTSVGDSVDFAARLENEADFPTLQYAPNIRLHDLADVSLGRRSVEDVLDYYGSDTEQYLVDYVSNRLEDLKQNPEFIAYTEAYGKLNRPYNPNDEIWAGLDSDLPEGVLAEFWSPIPDALDSLQWPRNGMEGYQIKSALTKFPDVRNSELRTVIDAFDPQQRYTLEEAKDLASRSGWTVQVRELETPNWRGMQRQRDLEDPEVAYSEITVDATRADPERATYQHRGATHGYDNALAHTRVSIRTPRNGNDYYLLVEEMQSDLVQKGSQKPRDAQFTTSPAEAVAKLEDVSDEERKLLTLLGEDRHYQYYNWEGYRDFIDEIGAAELLGTDSLNGIPVTTDVVLDLIGNDNGYGSAESLLRLWSNWKSGSPSTDMVPSPDAWDFYDDVKDTFWQRVQPNIVTGENRPGISHPPVKSTDETVRMTIQALLAKAQQEGIDRIVIPPLERIAAERFDPGSKSFQDAVTPGSGFYDTYVTAVSKAIEELGLTSRPVQMNYPGGDILSQTANKIADVMTSRGGSFARTSDFWIDYLENGGLQADARAFMEDRRGPLPSGMDSYDFMGVRNGLENSNIYGFDLRDWASNPDQVPFSQAMSHRSERALPSVGTEILIQDVGNQNLRRPRFAEGGLAMENQMTRLMAEGGLNSDGMRVDPVSGNEVPAGSMASEVRDDIDAKLSEGEYVVPADVVRYYGVKFFEDLRSEAKGGLSEMEADGRIGGEPAPMEGAPRISEEEMAMLQAAASKQMGMAAGGVVSASPLSEDQLIENLISVVKNDPNLMNKLGQRGVMLFEGGLVDGYAEGGIVEPTFNPNQWMTVGGSYFGGNQQTPTAATPIENRTYRGPNGETVTIRFQNGVALDPIPAGYVPEAEYTTTDLQQTGSDRGDRTPFQAPQTPAVEREPEDPAVYRGVNFNDPVAAAKAALEGTQGTMGNRLMVGAAGMVNPLLGAAVKQGLVANGLATARANLMVAQQYGTPEQVAEIEAALAEAEKNAPSGVGGLLGNVFGDMFGSGQNLFDDAVAQYEKYGVLTPQGAIDAVTSGAGIGRAKAMTAAEVQAGQDYAKKGDDRDTSWAGGQVHSNQNKPSSDRTSAELRASAQAAADKLNKPLATGGRARGGLMGKANRT